MCIRAAFLLVFNPISVQADTKSCDTPVAHLVSVEGVIESRSPRAGVWQRLTLNAPICTGDILRTGSNSRGAVLVEGSDTLFRLDQTTTFQIVTQPQEKDRTLIELLSGIIHFISRVRHGLEVRTPYVNAVIEGTEFTVLAKPEESVIVLVEGTVLASNDAGSLRMEGEQTSVAKKGQAPQISTRIKPADAVQWMLHYQPILHGLIGPAKVAAQDPLGPTFSDALAALRLNDTVSAFASLKHIPATGRTPRFYNYRAALFLLVGRVEEAQRELERSLQLRADNNSGALSLQAMIAVAQNKKAEALVLANQAVAAGQNSAVPLIALSYAQQARFDLDSALASINQAIDLEPDNPYAYARQSELLLSYGDQESAETAAQKAVALDPKIELTQTVLGFARLAQLDLEQAKANFSKAIELSSSSPMPHLGLGLALIRQGELEVGRRELEIATVLDPSNTLVRSYMGKAYYEERRDGLAAPQYSLAKGDDPNDPTPWYYHALLLHQQGQTIEALHNLQTSIGLNDNRAVYRSQLLMDQDQAARSATMGQIYRDLDFEQLALIEGWKSLEADPTDYSGHRLLADSYTHLPRHEVARVSELLQSQLLQPVNSTPIQPTMAESTLHTPDGMGPSDLSFNEYSALFNRDGITGLVSGVIGSDDMAGEEVLLSGIKGNVSFSLGQYHYETDGWWENNDLDHDIYVGFLQANLSHKTSLQMEARRSRKEHGDLSMHFYEDGYDHTERSFENFDSLRFGLHHVFNPRSELIASVIFGDKKAGSHVEPVPTIMTIDGEVDSDSWSTEVRQLMRWNSVRATVGVGYLEDKAHTEILATLNLPIPCAVVALPFFMGPAIPPITYQPTAGGGCTVLTPIDSHATRRHANGYVYASIDLNSALTLDLGASYDDYSQMGFEQEQFNPKLGLTWQMGPRTTVRAAAFRTLKRPFVTSQTIEPTQVAGFNQFFDGINGEQAERYGVALDHRFSKMLFSGVELSHRRRRYPVTINLRWDESLGEEEQARAYLYLTPTKRTALSLEYLYERFHDPYTIDTTHRFPLSFSYFHPAGVSSSLRPTFVRQYGQYNANEGNERERFWNVDLSFDYRLPQRRGQLSLDVRNLLDDEFGYNPNDDHLPLFMGDRTISLRVSLDF